MQDGECLELATLERHTKGSESGFWPTPITAYDGRTMEAWEVAKAKTKEKLKAGHYKKGCGAPGLMDLQRAVRIWATPTKADAQGGPGRSDKRTGGDNLRTQAGGQLNPSWVAWLMGWPIEWTDCGVSATDKFRQWCASHGTFSDKP
jgi:hypothetical protein